MSTWLLPENIADVLPSEARKIEELRRRLLDRFCAFAPSSWSISCRAARSVCAPISRRRSRASTRTC